MSPKKGVRFQESAAIVHNREKLQLKTACTIRYRENTGQTMVSTALDIRNADRGMYLILEPQDAFALGIELIKAGRYEASAHEIMTALQAISEEQTD